VEQERVSFSLSFFLLFRRQTTEVENESEAHGSWESLQVGEEGAMRATRADLLLHAAPFEHSVSLCDDVRNVSHCHQL